MATTFNTHSLHSNQQPGTALLSASYATSHVPPHRHTHTHTHTHRHTHTRTDTQTHTRTHTHTHTPKRGRLRLWHAALAPDQGGMMVLGNLLFSFVWSS